MFVLAIDTATPAVTAGVVEVSADGSQIHTVTGRVTVDPLRHVEALVPQLGQCLAELELTPGELSAIVVGSGPGPFTGLRVGMATAAAYADALDLPLYEACSLDAVAYAVRDSAPAEGNLLVATDARRKEVYWAVYDATGARLTEPAVDTPARLAEILASGEVSASAATGQGAAQYADMIGLPVCGEPFPSCEGLVQVARERILAGAPTEPPRPRYLRRPDATPAAQIRSEAGAVGPAA